MDHLTLKELNLNCDIFQREMDMASTFLLYLNIFRTPLCNKFSMTKNWASLEPKYQNNLTSPLYSDSDTNPLSTFCNKLTIVFIFCTSKKERERERERERKKILIGNKNS